MTDDTNKRDATRDDGLRMLDKASSYASITYIAIIVLTGIVALYPDTGLRAEWLDPFIHITVILTGLLLFYRYAAIHWWTFRTKKHCLTL